MIRRNITRQYDYTEAKCESEDCEDVITVRRNITRQYDYIEEKRLVALLIQHEKIKQQIAILPWVIQQADDWAEMWQRLETARWKREGLDGTGRFLCAGNTKSGNRCKKTLKEEGAYCGCHKGQENARTFEAWVWGQLGLVLVDGVVVDPTGIDGGSSSVDGTYVEQSIPGLGTLHLRGDFDYNQRDVHTKMNKWRAMVKD